VTTTRLHKTLGHKVKPGNGVFGSIEEILGLGILKFQVLVE
jgi:hypothetical protein